MNEKPQRPKLSERERMERQTHDEQQPPTNEEVRRALGFDLIPENKRPGRDRQH
ncbi:hypothetical protein [Rugamonas sp. DEMB1]|uniref:hypothetical protein n=1 Tax=Rugamonas sp. DEMB1 TaxID=3039386 RepID=UPI00244C11FF|nr:hypothetical protein [Rugamonas sp. DEMB1]WGG48936.1 hypothetical protein QC826_20125 [Rugamonas sp. DEMB1]